MVDEPQLDGVGEPVECLVRVSYAGVPGGCPSGHFFVDFYSLSRQVIADRHRHGCRVPANGGSEEASHRGEWAEAGRSSLVGSAAEQDAGGRVEIQRECEQGTH